MSDMNNKERCATSGVGCCCEPPIVSILQTLLAVGGAGKVLCVGAYNFIRRKESKVKVSSQLKNIYDNLVASSQEIH